MFNSFLYDGNFMGFFCTIHVQHVINTYTHACICIYLRLYVNVWYQYLNQKQILLLQVLVALLKPLPNNSAKYVLCSKQSISITIHIISTSALLYHYCCRQYYCVTFVSILRQVSLSSILCLHTTTYSLQRAVELKKNI